MTDYIEDIYANQYTKIKEITKKIAFFIRYTFDKNQKHPEESKNVMFGVTLNISAQ